MAFQPIVDVRRRSIFAFEALVRGREGQPAAFVLDQVTEANRYSFDQACRIKALELAAALGAPRRAQNGVSINFMPGAVYEPANCLRLTLEAAHRLGIPLSQIIFEVTEQERVSEPGRLTRILTEYRRQGLLTAIDDFGSGYAGLGLLADFQPDILKLDMGLTRAIDTDPVRRAIVAGIVRMAGDLGVIPVAEGIETRAEMETAAALGVAHMQGYLFAHPAFEALPDPLFV
ncbi:EAL domain-containing protein [Aquabacter spiritensis]|uniref:EAL domain-containing protein (Putative c-di-GMP-specific phosphodiesterase class I) n=1 Tax=Aquabacter spiritensis TaxID=933073 RepID=A0A4R3LVS5_9HYPH|nr:EAL domain-containing protein [Aquabacter spiritensis]TCT04682.1 EAL domain-containing protein (putative c-di-GMP-specific phosphodiesterase class I) [Aquabacter spiritensis]